MSKNSVGGRTSEAERQKLVKEINKARHEWKVSSEKYLNDYSEENKNKFEEAKKNFDEANANWSNYLRKQNAASANHAFNDNRAAATRASKQLKSAKKNLDAHNAERNYEIVKDNVNNLNREYARLDNEYWRENDEDVRKEIRKDMVDISDKLSSAKSAFRKISKNDNLESYIDDKNSIRPLRFPNPKDLNDAKLNAAEDHIKRQFNRDALKDRRMAIADVNGGGYGGEQIRQNEDGSYQLERHAHRQASVVHKSNNLKEILKMAAERNGYNNDEYDPQDAK